LFYFHINSTDVDISTLQECKMVVVQITEHIDAGKPTPEDKKITALKAPVLLAAHEKAIEQGLKFSGRIYPEDAYKLFMGGVAHLIDVRSIEERKFVGHVPNTLHIAWQTGPALIKNPRFLRELENKLSKDAIILLLCRSGKRSAAAAEAATAAGFKHVFNIQEGFEGDLDDKQQRVNGGWRQRGLPWVQD
jgi:rhodanese-related sulfurtransferase